MHRDAQVDLSETSHWKHPEETLVVFLFDQGAIYKAAVTADGPRNVRLVTFYNSDQEGVERSLERG